MSSKEVKIKITGDISDLIKKLEIVKDSFEELGKNKSTNKGINSLIDRYDMDDEDAIWLCTHKLKEYGLTVADLQNEKLVEKDKR